MERRKETVKLKEVLLAFGLTAAMCAQHAYNLQHYREHSRDFALQLVKSFKMPSFGTGAMADVHLCKIKVLRQTHPQ